MLRFLTMLSLCGLPLVLPAALPTARVVNTTISPTANGQRFLFLVDISSSMEPLQPQVEASIYDLIRSGIGGYMQAGDSYGMWTFNKQTYPGRFPMQVWDPRKVSPLGTIAAAFLSEQTYEKSSNLKQAIASLAPVVRSVSNLNVLIISDGGSAMAGTPFDEAINADYKKKKRERKDLKRPFITTLIVRDGWFVSSSVKIAGQAIPMPDRPPPEIAVMKTNLPPVAKAPPVARPKVVHTVVVDAIPNPTAAPTPSVPDVVATASPADQLAKTPAGDEGQAAANATRPPSAVPANLVEAPKSKVLQITTRPSSNPTNAPLAAHSQPTPIFPESLFTSGTAPTNTMASGSPSAPPQSDGLDPVARPNAPATVPSESDPSLAASALATLAPTPVPVAARELSSESPSTGIQAQAMTAPPQTGLSAGLMLALGGVLLGAALFLLLITLRRFRPVPQGSLITQSMQRR